MRFLGLAKRRCTIRSFIEQPIEKENKEEAQTRSKKINPRWYERVRKNTEQNR